MVLSTGERLVGQTARWTELGTKNSSALPSCFGAQLPSPASASHQVPLLSPCSLSVGYRMRHSFISLLFFFWQLAFWSFLSLSLWRCSIALQSSILGCQLSMQCYWRFFSERELKFMFAIGYRPSVCLSVCNVRAPYSGDWNFRQYFYAMWYLGHPWPLCKNFTEIVPGKPLRRGS